MSLRGWLRELKESAPSWGVSLIVHVLLIVAAGMVTWVVVRIQADEQTLVLRAVAAGADEVGTAPEAGGGGTTAMVEAAQASRPATVILPTAPAATDLEKVLARPPMPEATAFLTDTADPASDLARALAASPTAVAAPGGRVGVGLLDGTSAGFGQHIGQLRGTGLDIVLVLDATDSMAPYIEQAKLRLHQILDVVTGLVPSARFGMVTYKDYGDDYGPGAVKWVRVSDNVTPVREFIDATTAGGGADIPEPIHEGIRAATSDDRMGWNRRRRRVVILVGDSPCHPSGRKEAFALAAAFAKTGGTINVIDVGGTGAKAIRRTTLQPDLARVAKDGGGEAFLLTDTDAFWRYLIVSVFGQRFEQDVGIIIKKLVREE
ncbi:MAG TPA: hypothetical protein VM431_00510 [Phycisphaerae bacterium]|nr:hypothetical protein [Phycisphaerae bacterium]